jgi:hypothetical protein
MSASIFGRDARKSVRFMGILTLPNALVVISAGVLLVVSGYVRGREGIGYALWLYWPGQLLIFGTVIYGVVARTTSKTTRQALVVIFAAVQSFLRWSYSPHAFAFSDELQHLRALNNLLATDHLFNHNYSLPISSRYPGLENVAAELVRVASIGSFPAGTIVAGTAHVLGAACVLLLFRQITRSDRVAGIAAVIYLLNPHSSHFNTSFVYESLALPFAVLTLLFAVRFAARDRGTSINLFAVVACMSLVVMTHHVTALVTIAVMWLIAIAATILRRARPMVAQLVLCADVATLIVCVWVFMAAPVTVDYLGDPVHQLISGVVDFFSFSSDISLPGAPVPAFDRIVAPAGMLLTLCLLVTNLFHMRRRSALEVCWIGIAFLTYGAAGAVRVLVSDGPELSGRMLTFASLFSAVGVAVALARLTSPPIWRRPRWRGTIRMITAAVVCLTLFLASIATGLPGWFQRVPNGFWIEAQSGSGFDNVGISRAEWAAENLYPGARFVGDITALVLMSSLAPLDPVKDPAAIYYSDRLTPEDIAHIKSSGIIYVDVDTRLAEYTPIGGKYFPDDIHSGIRNAPMNREGIAKFDTIAGTSRIYDSGYARLYDMRGGRDAPYAR